MKIIDYILRLIGSLGSYIYPLSIHEKIVHIRNRIYTYWLERNFCYLGENVILIYPSCFYGTQYISIGNNSLVGYQTILAAHDHYLNDKFHPQIIIGEYVSIGDNSNISCCNYISIGNGVLMGRKVMINDTKHGTDDVNELDIRPSIRPLSSKGAIIIEDNVWIGENVSILGNVRIGQGAIIAAGAVVTKNIPAYSIAAGVPAKVIKILRK